MKYGKVDTNQASVVKALKDVGVSVQSLASLGKGVPDLLAAKGAKCWVIEVKSEKGKLTPDQEKWIAAWRGEVHIVRSAEDALKLVGVIEK